MDDKSPDPQLYTIQADRLTKSFGNHLALKGIDLGVSKGESIVILGPNGAGKTTLIKVLATIMNPSSGKVLINGLGLKNNTEEIQRRIGVVTHQTYLYSHLTAYENLKFYSSMYDIPRIKERIGEVAAMVGMTSRLHDRVETLSRGMRQRFSIARSLLHKPSIMLLDEPETGLDQQAVSMLWEALQTEEGEKRTTVLATHNLEKGLELGDRLLILNRGKIVYESQTQTLDLADLKEVYHHSTRTGA